MLNAEQFTALAYLVQQGQHTTEEKVFIAQFGNEQYLWLKTAKYVSNRTIVMPNGDWHSGVLITDLGAQEALRTENYLNEQSQQETQKAKECEVQHSYDEINRKKNFRHDWRVAIVSALISFALGLIVEHFVNIFGYLTTAFSVLFHP